jgi:hypothetical protein
MSSKNRRKTIIKLSFLGFFSLKSLRNSNKSNAPFADFPGMCFASTKCATIEPLKSWELSPFCGRSTCVLSDDNSGRLFELVEDCGPLPKANPKCKLSDKTNKTASFPDCCPLFECEEGAKLEYPDIPTLPPPSGVNAAEPKNVQPEAPQP